METKPSQSFVLYKDMWNYVQHLNDEEKWILLTAIFTYQIDWTVPEIMDRTVMMAFISIRSAMDRDGQKWEQTREKRRNSWRIGGYKSWLARAKPEKIEANEANASKSKQIEAKWSKSKQNEANEAVSVSVPVSVTVSVSDTEVTTDTEVPLDKQDSIDLLKDKSIERSDAATEEKIDRRNPEVNLLIELVREEVTLTWRLYSKWTRERQFATHLLRAKEFGEAARQAGFTSRSEFIRWVIRLSAKIKYAKDIHNCETLYRNYADVYNMAKKSYDQQAEESPKHHRI